MTPVSFPEANANMGPPEGMAESQVATILAFKGTICGGSCDGTSVIVVAWKPTEAELKDMQEGKPVYLSMFGTGLPPHYLTTNFTDAMNCA